MIQFVIPIISAWLPMWEYLIPIFCLAFLACIPVFVRMFFRR